MKRILLTSTALVAFAGAAAADISLSGSATFKYNSESTPAFSTDTSITAAASTELDNGFSASVSFTIDPDATSDEVSAGDITISSDSASLTYYVDGLGDGASHIGAALAHQGDTAEIFADDPSGDASMSASATLSGATVSVSINATDEIEVGLSTDLGGTSLAAGYDDASGLFGAQLAGSAGGADYTLGFGSNDSYGLEVGTTAGGADLTLNFGSAAGVSGWTVGASMPMGDATVTAKYSDDEAWEVGVSTDLDGVTIGATFGQTAAGAADTWSITAGIAQDAVAIDASFNQDDDISLLASYDLGNGLVAYAGYLDNGGASTEDATYVGVEYDLGGGASVAVSSSDHGAGYLAGTDFGQDYADGTTVEVSFSF